MYTIKKIKANEKIKTITKGKTETEKRKSDINALSIVSLKNLIFV